MSIGLFNKKISPVQLIKFGEAVIRREGKDITLVAIGCLVVDALKAAEVLRKMGLMLR